MTKAKISSKNSIQNSTRPTLELTTKLTNALLSVCAVFLTPMVGMVSFAPETFAQYGLGLPKSAGSGGATRSDKLPEIMMLVPEDGAKTFATRPTFYWYIAAPTPEQSATESNVDQVKPSSNQITFFLRDGYEKISKSIFIAEGKIDKPGLYKFTLPENSPELVTGKVQRWQIRWQSNGGNSQINVYAPIRRDEDMVVAKAIAVAKNDLEKARIFTKKAYWYDAIDAYTSWLIKNPQDQVAKSERGDLLKEGLKSNTAFSQEQQANVAKLLVVLDATTPTAINLQTKALSSPSLK
jgi:hypothetical protein